MKKKVMRFFCLHLKYTINKQMGAFKLDYGDYFYCTKKCNKSNHLGNVLTLFTDKKIPVGTGTTVSYYKADLVSSMDYSPFGAPLKGRTFNGNKSRVGFNGKEKDNEVEGDGNSYDFGARISSPRLGGRFFSLDPLSNKYPEHSPYLYADNCPIAKVDINGEEGGAVAAMSINPSLAARQSTVTTNDVKAALMYTDANDILVLVTTVTRGIFGYKDGTPRNVDGTVATKADVGFAAAGLFAPGIAGSAVKNGVTAMGVAIDASPVVKMGVKASKMAYYTAKYGSSAIGSAMVNRHTLRDALIKAGDVLSGTWQAHHIIPFELIEKNKTVQDAIKQGFDMNGIANGMPIDISRHSGSHKNYTNMVEKFITNFSKDTKLTAKEVVEKAVKSAETFINSSKGKIN